MEPFIHAHSGLRWLLLFALIIAVINAYRKSRSKREYTKGDKKINLATLVLTHIQLIIGIILYFGNKRYQGFSQMDVPVSRFLAVEHLLGMLIAIAMITWGYRITKKSIPDTYKHKRVFLWFGIALLIILISIPWPFRGVGFEYFGYY